MCCSLFRLLLFLEDGDPGLTAVMLGAVYRYISVRPAPSFFRGQLRSAGSSFSVGGGAQGRGCGGYAACVKSISKHVAGGCFFAPFDWDVPCVRVCVSCVCEGVLCVRACVFSIFCCSRAMTSLAC